MLKSDSLLLVLLLATCSPPEPRSPQQPVKAQLPDVQAACPGPVPVPGARRRNSLSTRSLHLTSLGFGGQLALPWAIPGWLQRWISRGISSSAGGGFGTSSSSFCLMDKSVGAGSRWQSASSSRGWGIRGATAAIVDAGGTHSDDGDGLRGGRQTITWVSSGGSGTADGGRAAGGGGGAGGTGGSICSDTCYLARNGVCEDGSKIMKQGHDGSVQVACDFGTDCTDCGPYDGVVPTFGTDMGFKGPIDFLRRKGVKVFARRVSFEPNFLFAYTDPKEDLDVSEQVERAGCLELGIVQVFRQVLSERCAPFRPVSGAGAQQQQSGAAPLVVDVGANFGYFALYAAMLGCRVVAVEPVPRFVAFLHWNMAANGLRVVTVPATSPGAAAAAAAAGARVMVVERALTASQGGNVSMIAPRKGVWGTASVVGIASGHDQDMEHITVESSRLDDVVGSEKVLLLKVDVEGYEPLVMRSAQKMLSEQRVENILMEYSPGMPETLERYVDPAGGNKPSVVPEDPPTMLLDLLQQGLTVVQLPDNFAKSGFGPQLKEPIPKFDEVTQQSVLYDLADVAWFRSHSGPGADCPWPKELSLINAAAWGDGCLKHPEDSHPKGLRVTHAYNTNLWASRNRSELPIGGPVGLFGPEQDETKSWWSQRYPGKGVGNRACEFLPPGHLLRSRCRCNKPEVCGREEEALLKALAEGRMPRPPSPSMKQ